ncbi:L,D-transpeptidase family protein [soil metagenome]
MNLRILMLTRFTWLLLFFLGFSLYGCGQQKRPANPNKDKADTLAKDWNRTIPGSFSAQQEVVFDSVQLKAFFKKYPGFKTYAKQIRSFYQSRNYSFAWFDGGKLIEQAGNLSNRVENIQNDGVYKKVPYRNALDSLLDETDTKTAKQPDVTLELMLTAQYFTFSNFAWEGMSTSASAADKWYLPRKKVSYRAYLDSVLKAPAKQFLADAPVYRQYELLRGFLRKYQALNTGNKWLPIAKTKKPLQPGDTAATISQVKTRLYKLEDFRGDTLSPVYNDELAGALKQFQERHGLLADGLLNKETYAALNVPLDDRIEQILVNMERSRWLPVKLSGDYVAVNIPDFKLYVYHADSVLWNCKVVVGKTMHQTTVFYGEIKYVVFRPYWNVPKSIVRKEILPAIRKNGNYIARHNMEIIGYHDGLPDIRQKPGPENSLGLVKFLFPNSYNIYLHDTPTKSLFGETTRAFSHGCIRIGEPTKMANFLLRNSKEWDAEKIDQAMHFGNERYVTLANKVPVYIAYFTAFVSRKGLLNFRNDIYNLDDHLASMIISGNGKYK